MPTFAEAVALHAEGRNDDAEAAYRDVLRQGKHFGAAYNLSLLYAARGEYLRALELAIDAVRLGPGSAQAHEHLGGVLVQVEEYALAVTQFEEALRIEPNFARACNNLGAALRALGRIDESIPWLERAIALDPGYVDARTNLGTSLEKLDRYEEARAQFDFVADRAAADPSTFGKIGFMESTRGRLDDAVAAFERGLAQDPRSGRLYNQLVGTKRVTLDDPIVRQMERLFEEVASLHADERIGLNFALGTVYMDNGRYGEAIEHFKNANAMIRPTIDYNERATLASFDAIARAFSPGAMQSLQGASDAGERHVFIVGMPRSGTTLTEQILASHPLVHGAGELETFRRVLDDAIGQQPVALTPQLLQEIGRRYEAAAGALAPDAARVTDKMPGNFRSVGLIRLALPKAKIIHTIRNPVDTCLSCFAQHFNEGQPFTYDLAELGRYYRAYQNLMTHWRNVLPPDSMLEIRYEELIEDFETHARRLVEYAGLQWDPACLEFHRTQRPIRTASVTQVRRPIYKSSIGRWRGHEESLKPLLEGLGIPPAL